MKEAYVKFDTAKLLKEKGFDWPCICYYDDDGIMHEALDYVRQNDGDDDDNDECLCPTQQMACRWLEETYGLFIKIGRSMDINSNYYYRYDVLDKDNTGQMKSIRPSKEDAIEAALQYALTNLIEQ